MSVELVPARRLTIHLEHDERYVERGHPQPTPLGTEVVLRAHQAGLAGATTLAGVTGFGRTRRVHGESVWGLVDRAPIVVMIVDVPERITAFLTDNRELLERCLVTVSDLRVARLSTA